MTENWTALPESRIRALIEGWKDQPVLVVGDMMLDRYLWGSVSRISPEAPVPVLEVERETFRLGGAANVAQNVSALGARPVLVSVLGEDVNAEVFRSNLYQAGLSQEALVVDRTRPTTLKTRIVARSQHLVRVDEESRDEITGQAADLLRDRIRAAIDKVSAVVISDYGKGVISRPLLEELLADAKRRDVPVCVDPKDTHFFSYTGVAVVTPNQHEAGEVLGFRLRTDDLVERAGREIRERLGSDCVLITRGEHGMSLFEEGRRTDFPATARQVYDVTGAGDTVVSTYAVALAGGAQPREAAFLSNRAAGVVVAEIGTAVPSVAALLDGGARKGD